MPESRASTTTSVSLPLLYLSLLVFYFTQLNSHLCLEIFCDCSRQLLSRSSPNRAHSSQINVRVHYLKEVPQVSLDITQMLYRWGLGFTLLAWYWTYGQHLLISCCLIDGTEIHLMASAQERSREIFHITEDSMF